MGKGNQIICGRDGENVRTFYFDPYGDFDEEKKAYASYEREQLVEELRGLSFAKRRRKVEQMFMDGRLPIEVDDDVIWDRINDNCEDEIDNISYEVGSLEGFKRIPKKERESEKILVAGYHDYGQVIAESDHCLVVIGDNESTVAIGCAPADTRENSDQNVRDNEYDSLREEAEAELEKTRKRADADYEITDANIDELAEEKLKARQEAAWEEITGKYRKDANAAMRKIHEFFGTQSILVRSCAWTSSRLKPYDEMSEEERNSYY